MADPVPRFNLRRPSEVQAWINEKQFKPSKVLGQNFLIDDNILRIMVESARVGPGDRIMEIGPGLGMVTAALLEKASCVVAVEKDLRLAAHLKELMGGHPAFQLVVSDALQAPLARLVHDHRLNKMISNLPYSVGSRVLVDCCMLPDPFEQMVITVQLEVAERLAAKVNTPDYGLLTIWAQLDYDVSIARRIAPSCFHPRPQVTSAIVVMKRNHRRRHQLRNSRLFDALIKHAFSRRRKQMGSILAGFSDKDLQCPGPAALSAAHVDAKRRPETLTVEEWIRLADAMAG